MPVRSDESPAVQVFCILGKLFSYDTKAFNCTVFCRSTVAEIIKVLNNIIVQTLTISNKVNKHTL